MEEVSIADSAEPIYGNLENFLEEDSEKEVREIDLRIEAYKNVAIGIIFEALAVANSLTYAYELSPYQRIIQDALTLGLVLSPLVAVRRSYSRLEKYKLSGATEPAP